MTEDPVEYAGYPDEAVNLPDEVANRSDEVGKDPNRNRDIPADEKSCPYVMRDDAEEDFTDPDPLRTLSNPSWSYPERQ